MTARYCTTGRYREKAWHGARCGKSAPKSNRANYKPCSMNLPHRVTIFMRCLRNAAICRYVSVHWWNFCAALMRNRITGVRLELSISFKIEPSRYSRETNNADRQATRGSILLRSNQPFCVAGFQTTSALERCRLDHRLPTDTLRRVIE